MKQTLDGMCVRVTHNHTFDGLWLKMANEFRRHLSKVLIKVSALLLRTVRGDDPKDTATMKTRILSANKE